VSQATQIYSREFDAVFLKLSLQLRELIETKIHDLGGRLDTFPRQRLKGRPEYRLRVGDYRIIYEFERERSVLYLIAVGHRRDVYR